MRSRFWWVQLAGVLGAGALAAGCPALTTCRADSDCENGYACNPEDERCVPACGADGSCPPGMACRDARVCVDPRQVGGGSSGTAGGSSLAATSQPATSAPLASSAPASSSTGTGSSGGSSSSSSSAGGSSSAPPRSSSAGPPSSSAPRASSAAPSSSASTTAGGPRVDTCNGIDDDNDQSFDEDGWAVAEVTRNALTTDAPSFVRVSVAAATGGFVAAYSAYCSGNSSDVFVNFIRLDGTYVLATGPCAAVRGRDAYLSPSDRSRHPWITSDGAGRAGLVWTEETLGGAELVAAELALDVNNTTNPVNVVDTLQVRPVHSRFGSVNAYGGVAVAPDGLLTALTGGVDLLDEQVYVQRLTRPGADLVVNGDAQIHPSTEGEATLAALPDGYVVAFTDAYTLYAQALSPSGQPLGTDTLLQVDRGDPLTPWELIALPLEGNRAVISWYEPTDGANWHIRFAVLTLTTRELRLLGGSIPTPADRGYFGAAYVGGDELVVSATSPTTQKLVLYRVDLNTGTTCGSPVTLESATDAGHSAVAFKDGKLLVAWHKGGDQPADQNSVLTVKLDRTGP